MQPANITCSSCSAWVARARLIRGLEWPCRLTHQEEIPSRIRRPSSVIRYAPSPRTIGRGSGAIFICVKGCQMHDRSLATSEGIVLA